MASSPESGPVKLTHDEMKELMTAIFEAQAKIGHKISDSAVWYGSHICNYLSALAVGAAMQDGKKSLSKKSAQIRRKTLIAFKSHLGRDATAEDLVNELSRHVTIPEFVSEAVRQDLEWLRSGR